MLTAMILRKINVTESFLFATFLSYDILFTGKHEANKLTYSQLCDFVAQLVKIRTQV